MIPLIAFLLPIILMISAFAINLAYMQLVSTELRVATDAAARAGGRRLSLNQDQDAAVVEAKNAAARNVVAGAPLLLNNNDIEFGLSSRANEASRWVFSANANDVNALRVNGLRTAGSASGPVSLMFPTFLSISQFEPTSHAVSTQIDRDIALALDRSGSMAYADDESTSSAYILPENAPRGWEWGDHVPPEARWLDLSVAVDGFLDALSNTPQDEYVSLATFSSSARLDQGMTLSYGTIRNKIDNITERFNGGGTNIGDGMRDAISSLVNQGRPFAARTIVLMTDGRWNSGTSPITVAREAEAAGITVHTVTFSDEADQQTMRRVAEITGGLYWHTPDGETLIEVFQEIANNNPTLLTE